MTSRIDELVAGLGRPSDDDITSEPSGVAGRQLLAAITAGQAPAPRRRGDEVTVPRRRRLRRPVGGVVVATGIAAAVLVGMSGRDSGPLRSYANAAVAIEAKGDAYEVQVKDAYADQREFGEAFAKLGLDVRLRIVPVSPGREREVVQMGSLHAPRDGGFPPGGLTGTSSIVMKCPPGQSACPIRVRLQGKMFRLQGADIVIGREARPGEIYQDARPQQGDRPGSLRLTGRTVSQALAQSRRLGLTSAFSIGEFTPDGAGSHWDPPAGWRPAGDRRVTGAWMRSSTSVGLLVAPSADDPRPRPAD
ncbi:hypothetical protein GCM10023085_27340 [Actinomadura viridis]|uniref:Uncharacterized protein n=1 Tax=Actinomadura viridis TaxID=58110 RepID=A0A931DBT6_9ACTN|nr:hypothetical protein [Actinomadura viridis]MBG6087280.1 hypothetical protein [Actinomadura viridis]